MFINTFYTYIKLPNNHTDYFVGGYNSALNYDDPSWVDIDNSFAIFEDEIVGSIEDAKVQNEVANMIIVWGNLLHAYWSIANFNNIDIDGIREQMAAEMYEVLDEIEQYFNEHFEGYVNDKG
jgi:hypothetical protein